jgi:type VI secretion system protein ImpM
VAGDGTERQGFRVDLSDERQLADTFGTILDQVLVGFNNRFSLWWTTGSERVPGSLLIAPGLPAPQNFAAFMDGRWDEWGWERPSTTITLDPNLPVLLLKPLVELPSFGRSHPGTRRTANQDAYLLRPDLGLWAVADGVGGHHSGEIASRTVVDHLNQVLPPLSAAGFVDDIRAALLDAHQRLRERAALIDDHAIVASTVAALAIYGNSFTCAWAGDSRIYLYRKGVLRQLTHDHVTEQAARGSAKSATVTRAVGAGGRLEVEMVHEPFEPDDRFLLCSDGLSGVLSDDELADVLAAPIGRGTIDRLIEDALVSGAPDNVTAIVVAVPPESRDGT